MTSSALTRGDPVELPPRSTDRIRALLTRGSEGCGRRPGSRRPAGAPGARRRRARRPRRRADRRRDSRRRQRARRRRSTRASRSAAVVTDRTRHAWLLMVLAAAIALAISGALAWWQARRLTRPVDALVRSAERLGGGDFSAAEHALRRRGARRARRRDGRHRAAARRAALPRAGVQRRRIASVADTRSRAFASPWRTRS